LVAFSLEASLRVKSLEELELKLPDIVPAWGGDSTQALPFFHIKGHIYLLVDDLLNSKSPDSEILKLNLDLEIIERLSFRLPEGASPETWFVDDEERVYIASNNWCSLGGCPSKMMTLVSRLELDSGRVFHSSNFGESIDLKFLPLSDGRLLLASGVLNLKAKKASKRETGRFWILDPISLRAKKNGRTKQRPLVIRLASSGFMLGYSDLEVYDNEGRRKLHIDSFERFGANLTGSFFELGSKKVLLILAGETKNTSRFVLVDANGDLIKKSPELPIRNLFKQIFEAENGDIVVHGFKRRPDGGLGQLEAMLLDSGFESFDFFEPQLSSGLGSSDREFFDYRSSKGFHYAVNRFRSDHSEILFFNYSRLSFEALTSIEFPLTSIAQLSPKTYALFSYYGPRKIAVLSKN
jgi:hypothetical protein